MDDDADDFFDKLDRELAEELKRQSSFIKHLEEAIWEIVHTIHPDYNVLPQEVCQRLGEELHRYVIDVNEFLDYATSELYKEENLPNEIAEVNEPSEDEHLFYQTFKKSKELALSYYPEIFEADSKVLRMLNLNCFVAMSEFTVAFDYLCYNYLDYYIEEDTE
jgi:hypothetical protein